jgi:hypothetical protein
LPPAWFWTRAVLGLLLVAHAPIVEAQHTQEIGVHATLTTADHTTLVGGGYAALRPSSRVRVAAQLGAGLAGDAFGWRGELLWHFLLKPRERRGLGAYGGGGVAVAGGPDTKGFVVLVLGIEAKPGARSGWALEVGIGGGVRFSLGYRWRRRVGG